MHATDGQSCFDCWDRNDNTCQSVFLREYPGWREGGYDECGTLLPWAAAAEGVLFHKVDGEHVKPPAPQPEPLALQAEVSRVSPGPYAAGEVIDVDVQLLDDQGKPRQFGGGEVVLLDADGNEVGRVPVTTGKAGDGSASLTLPAGGEFRLRFDPQDVVLQKGESLGGSTPKEFGLSVGTCNFKGAVLGTPGALHLAGEVLRLSGSVEMNRGGAASPADVLGTFPVFTLQLSDGTTVQAPARPDGQHLIADLTLPKVNGDEVVGKVSITGEGGGVGLCSGETLEVRVSRHGVALRGTGPDACYVGLPCEVAFTLHTPSGAGAAAADRFLAADDLKVITRINGDEVQPTGGVAARRLGIATTPAKIGQLNFMVFLKGMGQSILQEVQVPVRDRVELHLPDRLDFGSIQGGTAVQDTCVDLDFSTSRGALNNAFSFRVESPDGCDCAGVPVMPGGGTLHPLDLPPESPPVEATIGAEQAVKICWQVERCPRFRSAPERYLLVRSRVKEFPDEQARILLDYEVEPRSAFACWKTLLMAGGAGLFGAFVLYGFIWPVGFDSGDRVLIVSERSKFKRARKRSLRELRGGRKGWYRSACVHFGASADAVGSKRDAVFSVRAGRGGPELLTSRPVRFLKRSGRPQDVDAREGEVMQRNGDYDLGSLFVRIGS